MKRRVLLLSVVGWICGYVMAYGQWTVPSGLVGKRNIAAPNDTAYVDTGQVFLMAAGTHAVFSAGSTAQIAHAIIDTISKTGSVLVRNSGALTVAFTAGNSAGIGVATPQNKLDVEGNAAIGATYSGTNNAPANGLIVEGRVGIGVTNPTGPLEIATGTRRAVFADNWLNMNDGTETWGINVDGDSFFLNWEAAVTTTPDNRLFTFLDSGGLGIGTQTPDHKLEIVTGANCSEIDPSETSWTNCSSREEWKEDIAEVDTAAVVAAMRQVRPKKYTFTDAYVRSKYQSQIDAIALDSTLTDSAWQIKNIAIEARIAAEEKRPQVGFMAGDVYPLAYALEPTRADSNGYSLDPIVQGQQVLILNLLRRVEALEARVKALETR